MQRNKTQRRVRKTSGSRNNKFRELAPADLRWKCPSRWFTVRTSAELEPLDKIVGQERAIEAIRLGALLRSPGYNIYISGLTGTGRLTTVQYILEQLRQKTSALYDYCYVHNFDVPEEPILLKFSAGMGKAFAIRLQQTMQHLQHRIREMFQEEGVQRTREEILRKYEEKQRKLLEDFQKKIAKFSLVVAGVEEDERITPELFFHHNGKFYPLEDLGELVQQGMISAEDLRYIQQHYEDWKKELNWRTRQSLELEEARQRELAEHDQLVAYGLVKAAIEQLQEEFAEAAPKVREFLNVVEEKILSNIPLFLSEDEDERQQLQELLEKFHVNVLVDRTDQEYPPVIVETNPTYAKLFGTIEAFIDPVTREVRSSHMQIRAGSLLKADGGYLILNVADVLNEPRVWPALKRVLLHRKLEIQSVDSPFMVTQFLKPEPIEIDVKVILIGNEEYYSTLYVIEEDFRKIFKIHAIFDYETPLTPEMAQYYARFVAKICREENLLHFHRSGLCALIEFIVAHSEKRGYGTLRFSNIADVIREASFYAQQEGVRLVSRKHVEYAVERKRWRNSLYDEKIHQAILEQMIVIQTEGVAVGQINGLTVYTIGGIAFGKPVRISASAGPGNAGIVNIEREVDLSGSSFDKGVLILSGILRNTFGYRIPLSLTASIALEQFYDEIDGDSASSAEYYALISALSHVPLKQSIAVTGSVDQYGNVQAVGAINEKICGFFELCRDRGLTGDHGVIIPEANIRNLMLPHEVVQAVKKRKFHIYPVRTVQEGLEILTDQPVGEQLPDGSYPPHTIYGLVQRRLEEFREIVKESESDA